MGEENTSGIFYEGGRDDRDSIIEVVGMFTGEDSPLLAVLRERLDFGAKKYGAALNIEDGRKWNEEAVEELLDAAVYLAAAFLVSDDGKYCAAIENVVNAVAITGKHNRFVVKIREENLVEEFRSWVEGIRERRGKALEQALTPEAWAKNILRYHYVEENDEWVPSDIYDSNRIQGDELEREYSSWRRSFEDCDLSVDIDQENAESWVCNHYGYMHIKGVGYGYYE